MKIVNMMSDKEVKITGGLFAIALERKVVFQTLVEREVLSALEAYELHDAAFNGNVTVLRRLLTKIYDLSEEEHNDFQT